jgi:hypothetical protein
MPEVPPRRRIDLFQRLGPAARAVLALAVIALVSAAAWWTGRDDPVPTWITARLVPALGWIWLALAGVALASSLASRWRRRGKDPARRTGP